MSAVYKLRGEEAIALAAYILVYRKNWKINLQEAWESGRYGLSRDADQIPVLQRLRNTLGPSGLQKIKRRDIVAASLEINRNRDALGVQLDDRSCAICGQDLPDQADDLSCCGTDDFPEPADLRETA